jgi:hypothetical protein
MPKQQQISAAEKTSAKKRTPTVLLELPLQVTAGQAKRLRAHLEAARQLYNAVLSEGQRRLRRMRADPAWQAARAIPRTDKQERQRAFGVLRGQYGFSDYALHEAVQALNCTQDPRPHRCRAGSATFHAGLSCAEPGVSGPGATGAGRVVGVGASPASRTSATIPACALCSSSPQQGTPGICVSQDDRLPAIIGWEDPVVTYGLHHRIKYARLLVRQASSARAEGADTAGQRYCVQLALGFRAVSQAQTCGGQ